MDNIDNSDHIKKQWILCGRTMVGLYLLMFLNSIYDMFAYPTIVQPTDADYYWHCLLYFFIWYANAKYCACKMDGHKLILVYALSYLIITPFNIWQIVNLFLLLPLSSLSWFGIKALIFMISLSITCIFSMITSFRLYFSNRKKKLLTARKQQVECTVKS